MVARIITAAVFSVFATLALAQSDAETDEEVYFSPLIIDWEGHGRAYPPDASLAFQHAGTVEIEVTLPRLPVDVYPDDMTLIAHGAGTETQLAVYISGKGRALAVSNGTEGRFVTYDFRGGGTYQIAVAAQRRSTRI